MFGVDAVRIGQNVARNDKRGLQRLLRPSFAHPASFHTLHLPRGHPAVRGWNFGGCLWQGGLGSEEAAGCCLTGGLCKGQKIHALFRDLPSKFCLDTMRMRMIYCCK